MRFRPPEEEIELYQTGFVAKGEGAEADILQRAETGKKLSNIVEDMEDPLVIALNSGWGTGKTWFLKRWAGAHNLENNGKALTIYISAFNHDYLEDPFSAIILAIDERLQQVKQRQTEKGLSVLDQLAGFQQLKKIAGKVELWPMKMLIRVVAACAATGASEIAAPIIAPAVNSVADSLEKSIEDYWKEKENIRKTMEDFRAKLRAFAKERKLIIIIDELDRARPDYALSMLEIIKHFFNVDNVHFILGVNMEALESMVKRRYGQEINAHTYLQRFIDLSLTLPDNIQEKGKSKQTVLAYTQCAAPKMGIDGKLWHMLQDHLEYVIKNNPISLRDARRILSRFSFAINMCGEENFLELPIAVGEICLALLTSAIIKPNYYNKFLSATIKREEILHYYGIKEPEYETFNTRYSKSLTSSPDKDDLLTRFNFIEYREPIPSYPNLRDHFSIEEKPHRSAFIWEALSKSHTQKSKETIDQIRDLAINCLDLKYYSPQFSIPSYINNQYLICLNIDLAEKENPSG